MYGFVVSWLAGALPYMVVICGTTLFDHPHLATGFSVSCRRGCYAAVRARSTAIILAVCATSELRQIYCSNRRT